MSQKSRSLVFKVLSLSLAISGLITVLLGSFYVLNYRQEDVLDSISLYTGSKLIASGEGLRLYDLDAQRKLQTPITGHDNFVLPYRNPVIFALPFIPFSLLPYKVFHYLVIVIGLGLLIASAEILRKYFGFKSKIVTFTFIGFLPVIFSLLVGQITGLSLFIWVLSIFYLKKGKSFNSGLTAALLLFKPQYMFLIPILLFTIKDKKEFLKGLLITGVVFLFAQVLFTGTGGLGKYLEFILATERPEYGSNIFHQVSYLAFLTNVVKVVNYNHLLAANIIVSAAIYSFIYIKKNTLSLDAYLSVATFLVLPLAPHLWEGDFLIFMFPLAYIVHLWTITGKKIYLLLFSMVYFSTLIRLVSVPFISLFVVVFSALVLSEQNPTTKKYVGKLSE